MISGQNWRSIILETVRDAGSESIADVWQTLIALSNDIVAKAPPTNPSRFQWNVRNTMDTDTVVTV